MPNYIARQLSLTRNGFRTGAIAIQRSIGISSLRIQLLATNEVAGGLFEVNFVRVHKPEDNIKCTLVRWSFITNTETEERDSIVNKIQICMATLQRYLIFCEQLGNLSSTVGGAAIRNIKPQGTRSQASQIKIWVQFHSINTLGMLAMRGPILVHPHVL